MQFLVFGDSIAHGAYDDDGGWAARLRAHIDAKIHAPDSGDYYHEFYNLSIHGENTVGLLERFDVETAARLRKYKDVVMLFAIGTNDSSLFIAEQKNRVAIEDYEKHLRTLIAKAQNLHAQIIFVSTIVVDEVRVNPCPWALEKGYTNAQLQRYDAIVRRLADEYSLDYIDVATPFIAAGGNALLDDGVHPTSDGHRVIYETVRDKLVVMNLI